MAHQDNEAFEIADLEYDVGGVDSTEARDGDTNHGIIYFVPPV